MRGYIVLPFPRVEPNLSICLSEFASLCDRALTPSVVDCIQTNMTSMMLYDTLSDSDRDSNKSDESDVAKEQQMFLWNSKYEKWHECLASFQPPCLTIVEYEDLRLEVSEKQLLHLKQKWFHGSLSRREAKCVLQDFRGGNGSFLVRTSESYHGKFAISFVHESKVKHVVIESRRDPVAGVLYNITPNGPVFDSLYDLVEEAQKRAIIQNHMFDVKLGTCPPKPNHNWLHRGVKSLSQVEQILRKEHRDGAFLVYRTQSDHAPYIVAYRSNGSIVHNLIMATQHGYSINNVTAPVLYKLIHYYMENPINKDTVLKHPVEDRDPQVTNSGMTLREFRGDRKKMELDFSAGALVTNISQKSAEWCIGDHRGDRQRFFPADSVRLLTKDELSFVNDLRLHRDQTHLKSGETTPTVTLNLKTSYHVAFELDDRTSSTILVEPMHPKFVSHSSFKSKHYKLSCPTVDDLEIWYHTLQQAKCLPESLDYDQPHKKKKGCAIC